MAICTRNRSEQLRRALESIRSQAVPPSEVLVVDNAPPDSSTQELVAEEFPQVTYLVEPRRGLDFARNHALHATRCDFLAFLDDDAIAASDWVTRLEQAFREQSNLGAITGRIEPLELETRGQQIFEADGGLDRGKSERLLFPADADRLFRGFTAPNFLCAITAGAGCNLAVRTSAAVEISGFDEALGAGTLLPGSDESDLLWRLLERGRGVLYEPTAIVYHEHRRNVDAVSDQLVGYQLALIAFLTKIVAQSRGRERYTALAFLGWRLVKPGYRLIKRLFGRDPLPARILMRMWGACFRGLTAYPASNRAATQARGAAC